MKTISATFEGKDVKSVTFEFKWVEAQTISFCIYISLLHYLENHWLKSEPLIDIEEWVKKNDVELELMSRILIASGHTNIAQMYMGDLGRMFEERREELDNSKKD